MRLDADQREKEKAKLAQTKMLERERARNVLAAKYHIVLKTSGEQAEEARRAAMPGARPEMMDDQLGAKRRAKGEESTESDSSDEEEVAAGAGWGQVIRFL